MPTPKVKVDDKEETILVLAVDVDNDLYRKTGIAGPLTGRVQNLNGATQLALADPEETDANTMFEAVKIYDQLKKDGYNVNVATITGSESEGYNADREVARQLELVLEQYKADSCIFVTDGASDKRVMPLIQSRIKINSVRSITMKQAEKLENTYFVILEKLKEPHYARIVFGIPAVLIMLFAISYALGAGFIPPLVLIGAYLLIKGFGLEDAFLGSFRGFGFSVEKMSFVFYLSTLIFVVASFFIAYGNYTLQIAAGGSNLTALSYAIEGFLLLLPIASILYLVGRVIDVRKSKHPFRVFKYGTYTGSSLILWVMIFAFVAWIVGQIYFGQLLLFTVAAIAVGMTISYSTDLLRRRALSTKKMKNKLVFNELGAMIGKVGGVDIKRGTVVINTSFGNSIKYSVDRVVDISDKIIIK